MSIQSALLPAPSSPLSVTTAATRVTPSLALAGSQGDLFEKLMAIIIDIAGQYTPERQLSAYLAFLTLHLHDAPAGGASQAQSRAVGASTIAAQARDLQVQAAKAMLRAAQSGRDAAEAAGDFYKSLSPFEENIVFRTANIKLPDLGISSAAVPPSDTTGTSARPDPFLLYAETIVGLFVDFPLPHEQAAASAAA